MKNDLEKFENRRDDWLADEIAYEETVSAWDFDEGHRLKREHEENCEAKFIKERHEKIHSYIKQRPKIPIDQMPDRRVVLIAIVVFSCVFVVFIPIIMRFDPTLIFILLIIYFILILTLSNTIQRRKK